MKKASEIFVPVSSAEAHHRFFYEHVQLFNEVFGMKNEFIQYEHVCSFEECLEKFFYTFTSQPKFYSCYKNDLNEFFRLRCGFSSRRDTLDALAELRPHVISKIVMGEFNRLLGCIKHSIDSRLLAKNSMPWYNRGSKILVSMDIRMYNGTYEEIVHCGNRNEYRFT